MMSFSLRNDDIKISLNLNSWLVVQNLKIARSRGFMFPEAFRLTLVKGIVRIKNVELQDRIKQHVPKSVRTGQVSQDRKAFNRSCKLTNHEPICDSAIVQHLLTNQSCALHYSDDRFSILSKGRSAFHLSALEATYIKVSRPILCRQKEFVYTLKISH